MTTPTTSMHDRAPGALVIEQLLSLQSSVSPRSGAARFFGVSPLPDDNASWYLGALGEIAVGDILRRLPDGWTAFHALPVGTKESDIDHIVVGPGGVFAINTKRHRGKPIWIADRTFMVSGHRQPHLRNAEYDADRVARLLGDRMPVPVHPMIVLVDPKSINMKKAPKRVKVIEARHLARWLVKRPTVLAPDVIREVTAVLADPTTWRAATTPGPDLMVRFALLDREVRSARRLQRLWVLGFSAAAAGGLFALLQLVPQLVMASFGL
ncbi:MAG: NERD domain-containing protein [Microbacteriaceae bacterium]|nr:NERD domain-containing protein [Microbacteriaceae bacterium]